MEGYIVSDERYGFTNWFASRALSAERGEGNEGLIPWGGI